MQEDTDECGALMGFPHLHEAGLRVVPAERAEDSRIIQLVAPFSNVTL